MFSSNLPIAPVGNISPVLPVPFFNPNVPFFGNPYTSTINPGYLPYPTQSPYGPIQTPFGLPSPSYPTQSPYGPIHTPFGLPLPSYPTQSPYGPMHTPFGLPTPYAAPHLWNMNPWIGHMFSNPVVGPFCPPFASPFTSPLAVAPWTRPYGMTAFPGTIGGPVPTCAQAQSLQPITG